MRTRAMTLTAARSGDIEGVLLALAEESRDAFEALCHLAIESGNTETYFDALGAKHPDRPWLIDSIRCRTRTLQPFVTGRSAA